MYILTLSPIPTLRRKIIDSHFVPIPTLRRDNSGIEPCQVGILTLPGKVRIPTLRRDNSGIVPIPTLRRTYILLEDQPGCVNIVAVVFEIL